MSAKHQQAAAKTSQSTESQSRFRVDHVVSKSSESQDSEKDESSPLPKSSDNNTNGRKAKVEFTLPSDEDVEPGQAIIPELERHDSEGGAVNQQTIEAVPHIDHYRQTVVPGRDKKSSRPTLAQLHEEDGVKDAEIEMGDMMVVDEADSDEDQDGGDENENEKFEKFKYDKANIAAADKTTAATSAAPKFGWIKGVLVRCVLNILGVMLYLRVSWVTGQAGIVLASTIVLLSCVVTTLTTLSMCAIATNGEIKGGGCYFMISRSLGPEYGGSIGVIFAFANAVGAAMYIVGFAETVRDLLKAAEWEIVDGGMNDVRIVGIVTCVVLMAICFIGVGFEAKMQLGLLAILTVSIINYYIGTVIPTSETQRSRGVMGMSANLMFSNMWPAWRDRHGFFSTFAIFFPAATGIMAGANISGDLRKPAEAIPQGTLLAILLTGVIYVSVVILSGATGLRDASGLVNDTLTMFSQNTTAWYNWQPSCAANSSCQYGLMNSAQMMEWRSAWGPLITAGVFAATLSSALASLVSAPKIFQAVCKDRLYPYISIFAKGYGSADEPRLGYGLSFVISILIILIGDLNAIAPIISNFFLASYALINYACFDASFSKQPGFRPAFKYYNMYLSLFGALLCLAVMFVISWWTALVTFLCIAVLWGYLRYRQLPVNWGGTRQAHAYKDALQALYKLAMQDHHVKNYRPQIIVLTGNPVARPSLVDFAANITKDNSLLLCGHVFVYPVSDKVVLAEQRMSRQVPQWLNKRHVNAFYVPIINPNYGTGVHALLQNAGLGRMRPNIVMMGYKNDWQKCPASQLNDYFRIIHHAFDMNYAVAILRLSHGLDLSTMMREHQVGDIGTLNLIEPTNMQKIRPTSVRLNDPNAVSYANLNNALTCDSTTTQQSNGPKPRSAPIASHERSGSESSFVEHFEHYAETKLTVGGDADGGSSSATPPEQNEEFIEDTVNLDSDLDDDQDEQTQLQSASNKAERSPNQHPAPYTNTLINKLTMFRGRHVTSAQRALLASINQFSRPIKNAIVDVWWLYDDGGLALLIPHLLTVAGSYLQDAKLRVFAVSSSQDLVSEQRSMAQMLSKFRIEFGDVMVIPDITKKPSNAVTIPVPRKGACSAAMYMGWLEMLSRDMPPILLVRGNQQSVLTYSL